MDTLPSGNSHNIPGVVKLLFETPSGFAVFSFDQDILKKDINDIWIYFVGNYWHKNIVWLHEFRKFEKKPVINLTDQTIDAGLTQMLWRHCNAEETIVVGSLAYKDLLQKLLGLNCHYEEAVNEVMWGLQNLMQTLLPQEHSVMTKDDFLPVSIGLNAVLNRYKMYVKKEMLNECIIKKAGKVYDTNLREKAHLRFLHKRLDEKFMELSAVDTKDWSLFKLATALKIMFEPHERLKVGFPHKIFSRNELTVIRRDAPLYEKMVNKDLMLAVYDEVVTLREHKVELLCELKELSENGVDNKKQVDCTCRTIVLTIPKQSTIDEEQDCRTTVENS